jgi:prepilin-type N-terminal cleavage/methylation domain-containing protein
LNKSSFSGFTLLELLLVLVCMGAIISWSMHHYQQKQRRTQTLQIESDIKSLQRALDIYFHATGCKQNGEFAQAAGNINCQDLRQYGDVVCSRPPFIEQYAAKLIDTGQTTHGLTPKPVYQLEIQAILSANLSDKQATWFQQQLAAKAGAQNNILIWDSLPTNSYVQAGDNSWILNGAGAYFRASQNENGTGGAAMPELSGSFCAN